MKVAENEVAAQKNKMLCAKTHQYYGDDEDELVREMEAIKERRASQRMVKMAELSEGR